MQSRIDNSTCMLLTRRRRTWLTDDGSAVLTPIGIIIIIIYLPYSMHIYIDTILEERNNKVRQEH